MAKISIALHDGVRLLERKRLDQGAKDMTAMELTRSLFQTQTRTYKDLGDEVVAIEGLRKGEDCGFQLYLAVEVGGKVVEMGLPFVQNQSGENLFLNPANIKPGDIAALAPHLPPDAEILMVWRLDKGMTQDITLTNDSVISSVAPSASGTDYSLLDRQASISCGGGASSKLEFVVDVMEVKLFCGEREDPIRMSTLMVPPPEAFQFDSPNSSLPPSPFVPMAPQNPAASSFPDFQNTRSQPEMAASHDGRPAVWLPDLLLRTSWEDSLRSGEKSASVSIFCRREMASLKQDPLPMQASLDSRPLETAGRAPYAQFDAPATIVLFRIPENSRGAKAPVVDPRQARRFMNRSETRLYLSIHNQQTAIAPENPVESPPPRIGNTVQLHHAPSKPGASGGNPSSAAPVPRDAISTQQERTPKTGYTRERAKIRRTELGTKPVHIPKARREALFQPKPASAEKADRKDKSASPAGTPIDPIRKTVSDAKLNPKAGRRHPAGPSAHEKAAKTIHPMEVKARKEPVFGQKEPRHRHAKKPDSNREASLKSGTLSTAGRARMRSRKNEGKPSPYLLSELMRPARRRINGRARAGS